MRSGALVLTDKAYKVGLQIENNVQEFTVRSILAHCADSEEQPKAKVL